MSRQKSIGELKDEFFDSVGHCISTQSPQNFTNVKNKFTQILQSERDRAEEERREERTYALAIIEKYEAMPFSPTTFARIKASLTNPQDKQ